MSHITSTLFYNLHHRWFPIPPPSSTPQSPFCRPHLTYPTSTGKMGVTLTTPTQHPQCMSLGPSISPVHRWPVTTVLRTQEWPEHHSREEQVLKPGTTPNTTQWQEMEAPMPIFGVSPTSFRPHYHSFPVTSCTTKTTLAFTAQQHYVAPQTSVLLCMIQQQRFEPNTSVYDQHRPLEINCWCWVRHFHFDPNTGVYSPTPTYIAQCQRVQPNING